MMVGYGLCGLYGGRGSAAAGIGETAGPDQPQEIEGETWYGFTIEDLGRIPGLDKYGTAVTFDGGAVLYSPLGASCVRYIETV